MKQNRILTGLLTAVLTVCMLPAVPASAYSVEENTKNTDVWIDKLTVSAEEAREGVPVFVRLNRTEAMENVNSCEFGIEVDSRCRRVIVADTDSTQALTGEGLDVNGYYVNAVQARHKNFTWYTFSAGQIFPDIVIPEEDTGAEEDTDTEKLYEPIKVLLVYVTISDPVPGESYAVTFAGHGLDGRASHFSVGQDRLENVTVSDGCIRIEGEPLRPVSYGDVDENGSVQMLDMVLLNQYIMTGAEVTAQGLCNADVNRDGKVLADDGLNILRAVIGLTKLPVIS